MPYAPKRYPDLAARVNGILDSEDVLGPALDMDMDASGFNSKLCSHAGARQQLPSQSTRQTPKYLRVIATFGDQRPTVLERDMAFLKWELVEKYIGSTADSLKIPMESVL